MLSRLLSEPEFKTTFAASMEEVSQTAGNVIDIWPYVQAVSSEDLQQHTVCEQSVESVYRMGDGHFDHILVMTRTKNVYLVIVVNLLENSIHGHHLLDLNREDGLKETSE